MNAQKIISSPEKQAKLRRRVSSVTFGLRDRRPAREIRLADRGCPRIEIARLIGLSRPIGSWVQRLQIPRLVSLLDEPASGAVNIDLERYTWTPYAEQWWSYPNKARMAGRSATSVHKLWVANDLKPYLTQTLKRSKGAIYQKKFLDLIGLSIDPPDKSQMLCCNEKIQQGLLLGIAHIRNQTYDYAHHRRVNLFMPLGYLQASLISRLKRQQSLQEFSDFFKKTFDEMLKHFQQRLIVGNYTPYTYLAVKVWHAKHTHFHMHSPSCLNSWISRIKRFVEDIKAYLHEFSFSLICELGATITVLIALRNSEPIRYV
ncbi:MULTISPECIES: IS630 family transposase [Pseudomonas]|uniref:IS630 family transposase n=1 Tax=Pseudomonas TaxID=286 RepID=UPI00387A89FD